MFRIQRVALTIGAAVAVAALPRALACQARSEAPRMADVMSPSEMRDAGVASMTPAQRAVLDAWLARYTAIVERAASRGAQEAAGAAGTGSGGGSSSGGGGGAGDISSGFTAQDMLIYPYGTRIAAVIDGGSAIALADGTIWEVYTPNRPATVLWAKGDYVIVAPRAVELNNEYFFQVTNGRDGTGAAVKWRGRE